MFCTNCGTKLPEEAKFCSSCGARVEILNKEQYIFDKTKMKVRRTLSDRILKIKNRTNPDFEDREIEEFMDVEHGGNVLTPEELELAIFQTKFDNEEDLAELIYRYAEYWDDQDFEDAKSIFSDDEGYHAAIGLLYFNGKNDYFEKDDEKAEEHFKKAIDLPTSLSMLMAIYGLRKDFKNLNKYVEEGLKLDLAVAYFYKGMLCLNGSKQDKKLAKGYVEKSVEKSSGVEKQAYLEVLKDM